MTEVENDRHAQQEYGPEVSAFVERFAADLTEGGMQRMGSRVFACVLASEEGALSAAALAERLRVSPATVSGAVRYLSRMRLLRRERQPGSRRELYRVQADVWYETFTDRDRLLNQWVATMRNGVDVLGEDTAAGRRVQETGEFFDFLQAEMDTLMDRWREYRAQRDGA